MALVRHQPARSRRRITPEPQPRFGRLDLPQCSWRWGVPTSGLSPRVDMRSHVMTVAAWAAAEADDAARVDLPCSFRATDGAQPVIGTQDLPAHPLDRVGDD